MKQLIDIILVLVVISISPLYAQTPKLQFSSTSVPTGDGPRSAILVDLDGDGNGDLAIANIRGSLRRIVTVLSPVLGTAHLRSSLYILTVMVKETWP